MLLVFVHLLIIAVCLALKVFNVGEEAVGVFFMVASSIATVIYVISLKGVDKWIKFIILTGFISRIILVLIDIFVTRLPDSIYDGDGFYNVSSNMYSNGYANIAERVHGGFFSKFLAISYFFIGSSKLSAQYVNVFLYAIAAVIFVKTLINFKVSRRVSIISVLILCLMPNTMLMNSILRRETMIELCVCASLFFLSKWYNYKRLLYAFLTVLLVVLASLFHTAFILVAPMFIIYFTLYDKKKQAVSFSITKMSKMLVLLVCAVVIGAGFLSMWSNKFSSLSDMDDVYTAANRARGGSVYLEGYSVNNVGQLILFTPLKLFYFLFSPVPWMFRNAMDVVSFVLDAMIYIVLIFRTMRAHKRSMPKLMLTIFISLAAVFALGTFNSGTAIRHRFSLLPYLLVAYSMTREEDQKNRKLKASQKTGKQKGEDDENS